MRLIDAEELKRSIAVSALIEDQKTLEQIIDEQPTIEPERKTGKFIGTEYDGYADGNPVYYEWQCSECGCVFEDEEPTYNFCPYCGARMLRGGDE